MSTIPESCIVLPSLDLDEKEALEIAITNLSKLEQQFTKICSNLDHRLSSLKGKLGGFNQRVGDSRQKVEVLKDVNEAITIVSTSRFPKEYKKHHELGQHHVVNEEYVNNRKIPSLDYDNNTHLNININRRVSNNANPVTKKPDQNYDDELKKIIRLTRGNFNSKRGLFTENLPIQSQRFRGLGDVPRDIKSIDSLILFNSKVNPYHNHSPVDNTSSNAQSNLPRKKQRIVTSETEIKDEAPPTLLGGETLSAFELPDSRFRPPVKPVPELLAPSQLGLKGIVKYGPGTDEMDNFVPSRGGTVKKQTLPDPEILEDSAGKASNLLDPSALSVERLERLSHADAAKRNLNVSSQQNVNVQPVDRETRPNNPNNPADRFAPVISQAGSVSQQANAAHSSASSSAASQQQMAGGGSSSSQAEQPKSEKQDVRQNSAAVEIREPIRGSNNASGPSKVKESEDKKVNDISKPKPSSSTADFLAEIRNNNVKLVKPKAVEKVPKENSARDDFLKEIQNPNFQLKKPQLIPKPVNLPYRRPGKDGKEKEEPSLTAEEHLKRQIQLRWEAMHKNEEKRRRKEEEEESEDDDT